MVYLPAAMQSIDPVAQALQPTPEPFVWGEGGAKLSPEQVSMLRAQGESLAQSDFSPVGHWTQGLGRVAEQIDGALKMKRAERMEGENRDYQAGMAEALASGDVDDATIARVLMDPNAGQGAQAYAAMLMKARQPVKPGKPHYWETNDGSLGMVDPVTGQPTILYQDPNAKMNFIPDGMGGGQWVAVPNSARGGDQASGVAQTTQPPAVGDVVDGYRFKGGDTKDPNNWEEVGGQASAPDPFRQSL